jgi:hypothetical protein
MAGIIEPGGALECVSERATVAAASDRVTAEEAKEIVARDADGRATHLRLKSRPSHPLPFGEGSGRP